MLTLQELRKKGTKDLQKELKDAHQALSKARIPVRMSQDKKSSDAKKKQRYIAQILTILNQEKHETFHPTLPTTE